MSGMTMSTPYMSSSGNIRPQSRTMMLSPHCTPSCSFRSLDSPERDNGDLVSHLETSHLSRKQPRLNGAADGPTRRDGMAENAKVLCDRRIQVVARGLVSMPLLKSVIAAFTFCTSASVASTIGSLSPAAVPSRKLHRGFHGHRVRGDEKRLEEREQLPLRSAAFSTRPSRKSVTIFRILPLMRCPATLTTTDCTPTAIIRQRECCHRRRCTHRSRPEYARSLRSPGPGRRRPP